MPRGVPRAGKTKRGTGRPPIYASPEERRQALTLSLRPDLLAWVESQAQAARSSLSGYVERLIEADRTEKLIV